MSQRITVREAVSSGYWHEEEARAVVAAWRASGERLAVFACQVARVGGQMFAPERGPVLTC